MKALEEKILREGVVLPGDVLKVNSFLNHNLDVEFLAEMGREIASVYAGTRIDRILTIEASGIALAVLTATELKVPVTFAKKNKTSNISGKVYTAPVHSYTHDVDYTAVVTAEFIKEGENILIIDDFLGKGGAVNGLIKIAEQAGANVVGAAIAIEKGFQGGGNALRARGIRVESLAIIESMSENSLEFRH